MKHNDMKTLILFLVILASACCNENQSKQVGSDEYKLSRLHSPIVVITVWSNGLGVGEAIVKDGKGNVVMLKGRAYLLLKRGDIIK